LVLVLLGGLGGTGGEPFYGTGYYGGGGVGIVIINVITRNPLTLFVHGPEEACAKASPFSARSLP
jgi:hypothetical protein